MLGMEEKPAQGKLQQFSEDYLESSKHYASIPIEIIEVQPLPDSKAAEKKIITTSYKSQNSAALERNLREANLAKLMKVKKETPTPIYFKHNHDPRFTGNGNGHSEKNKSS